MTTGARESDYIRQVHEFADRACATWLTEAREMGLPLACTECKSPSCCTQRVLSPPSEAKHIAAFVVQRRPDLIPRLKRFVKAWLELSPSEQDAPTTQFDRQMPCPFLVRGRCSIYEVRPLVCRAHFALELDEGPCNASDGRHVRLLGTAPLYQAVDLSEPAVFMPLAVGAAALSGGLGEACAQTALRMSTAAETRRAAVSSLMAGRELIPLDVHPLVWPLQNARRVWPDAPGQFGAERQHDVHTGVDLYCECGQEVVAMEDGIVRRVEAFTGPNADDPSPWWNDTEAVLVEGASGLIVYGEIESAVKAGDVVKAGQRIGEVKISVLKKFKGRPMTMLHMELMEPGVRGTTWWKLGTPQPSFLRDPTALLLHASGYDVEPFSLDGYDGIQFRTAEVKNEE